MPINTDLNIAPYFDDYDSENQFYKVLFKPGYALQARELTQLQTTLQNQIETFGDNIFKEGSIIKGCNIARIQGLQFVKLANNDNDDEGYDPTNFISRKAEEVRNSVLTEVQYVYTFSAADSGLTGQIIQAANGLASRPPNLKTFFFQYTNNDNTNQKLLDGELLTVTLNKFDGDTNYSTEVVLEVEVTNQANHTGAAFGIQSTAGVIFQKGHFLFVEEQSLIIEKYGVDPADKSVGYEVTESLVGALQDNSLYDNANGSENQNAPGADRLKLTPKLTVLDTSVADGNADFFTIIRYKNGNAVTLRDVSQYNILGDELAKRTYEESGDYIIDKFNVRTERNANNDLQAIVGPGLAYIRGYRVQNHGDIDFTIDNVTTTETFENQSVSINYGNYVSIDSIVGYPPLDFTAVAIKDSGANKIGEAFVRNITEDRLYLFGITMTDSTKRFSDAQQITSDGANPIFGAVGFGNDTRIKDTKDSAMIFNSGVFSVSTLDDITVPVRSRQTGVTFTANTFTLTQGGGSGRDFGVQQDDLLVVEEPFSLPIRISSFETTSNNSELNVVLEEGSGTASVYYNERIQLTTPYSKTLETVYVKFAYSSSTKKYSLGFPDVSSIESIEDSSGNEYKNSFRLRKNQKDAFYDISYAEFIPGRPEPTGTLTVTLKAFKINSSSGHYFFNIDSYPIDDVTDPLPANKIRSTDLEVYRSKNGRKYNLRESFDFRPHADKDSLASWTANKAAAPTISTAADGYTTTFSGSIIVPALDTSINADITSYNGRIDLLTADSYGRFSLIKGLEDQTPRAPIVGPDQFVVSQITIPGYPALSAQEASTQFKNEYAVRATKNGIKRYTMADIASIDSKVQRLEYYTSLNQLEQSVENLQILDAAGLTRFKNGYIVDPLMDLRLADLQDPEYSAAVHPDRKIMTPSLTTFPLDLVLDSATNVSVFPSTADPETATLARNAHVEMINQPYATNFRTLTSNFYSYIGQGELLPSHDFMHDVTTDPVPVLTDVPNQIDAFVEDIQSFIPQTQTATANIGEVQVGNASDFFPGFIEETTTTTRNIVTTTVTENVGDFVSNIQFNPFIRSRSVSVFMHGLRPNTRHYFFFDGVDVNEFVLPGAAVDSETGVRNISTYGEFGDAVSTDSNGVLRAIFRIPAGTFFVGDRKLVVTDVDTYANIDSAATSKGFLTYHSYNINVGRSSLQLTTRIPELDVNVSTTTRNVQGRARPQDPPPSNDPPPATGNAGGGGGGGGIIAAIGAFFAFFDPLAQTFYLKEGEGKGSGTVYASKIDVYFKRKSSTNGVTLQLREVINGYPSAEIIPFSSTHLHSSQVSVSNDASTATTFNFESPVKLNTDREYAIVLLPDANDPNYLAFTSKVGGTDLTPGSTQGQAVVQDWGDGVLFTSTNNKAWKSYQDEDLKFTLYRHDFNENTGTLTFKNDAHEFLTIENFGDNVFKEGEIVYQTLGSPTTVSIALDGDRVTGTNLSSTYSVGDKIHIVNGSGNEDVFTVEQIISAGELRVDHLSWFSASGVNGTPVVGGEVSYHNPRKPETLHLRASSAASSKVFSATSQIIGLESGTTADIVSIDNINLSYVQPLISSINDIITTTELQGTFVDPDNVSSTYNMNMKFGENNYFLQNGSVVYSRSNDTSGLKPFNIKVQMANQENSTSSPFVDINTASLLAYQYNITNNTASTSKFITKTIELAEDLDAEDIKVYLTAYRPTGTDIKVYIRPQHASDTASFDTIDWIELELVVGKGKFSSTSNLSDFREYQYQAYSTDLSSGVLEYTSGGMTYAGYKRFALKIELTNSSNDIHIVPSVKDYRGVAVT
jgi:hypothetical protein